MDVGSSEKKKNLEIESCWKYRLMRESNECHNLEYAQTGALRKLRVPLCLMLTYQQDCIRKTNEAVASDSVKQLI